MVVDGKIAGGGGVTGSGVVRERLCALTGCNPTVEVWLREQDPVIAAAGAHWCGKVLRSAPMPDLCDATGIGSLGIGYPPSAAVQNQEFQRTFAAM